MNPINIEKTALDRAIEYFAPLHAARRLRARAALAMTGSYIGASKSRRSLKEWVTPRGDADADTIFDLATLRERSRDLERNAPLATGAISTCVTNVVGTGLKLQSRTDRAALNLPDEAADAWEANTERRFRMWAESRECDAARTLPFAQRQELVFRQVLINGEAFELMPRFARAGSPYLLKLKMVEADRIVNENNRANTDRLIEGVEKDAQGAPVAYHILNQHPGAPYYTRDAYTWTKVPAFGLQTGLPNVLHLFRPLRPGQTRGVPYLAPVIETLKQLDRYTEAEIAAAVIASFFTVFVKTETGALDFDLSGLGKETGAKAGDADLKLASGAVIDLGKGEDIVVANPSRPNPVFEGFVTAIMEQIGTALEIPYEIIVRHFSSSYSASRAALLEAWRFFRGRRAWLAANYCQPIYEIWLFGEIAAGRIAAPGYFADPLTQKAYNAALWIGDAPGYIDPAKDIDASVKRMEAGISTLDEETTLITGGDMEKNMPRIRKERKELAEIGLWQPAPATKPGTDLKSVPAPDQEEQKKPEGEEE